MLFDAIARGNCALNGEAATPPPLLAEWLWRRAVLLAFSASRVFHALSFLILPLRNVQMKSVILQNNSQLAFTDKVTGLQRPPPSVLAQIFELEKTVTAYQRENLGLLATGCDLKH